NQCFISGNDRTNPARYHPFYITDSKEGGFGQKSEADQKKQRVFGGVSYDAEGYPYPTAAGRYCEWTHKTIDKSAETQTFDSYLQTLRLVCDDGEPAYLNWTVVPETPEILYYQVDNKLNVCSVWPEPLSMSTPKRNKTTSESFDSFEPTEKNVGHTIDIAYHKVGYSGSQLNLMAESSYCTSSLPTGGLGPPYLSLGIHRDPCRSEEKINGGVVGRGDQLNICYSHNNLGWKIHVVDAGYRSQRNGNTASLTHISSALTLGVLSITLVIAFTS
ncbi:unnamed protein product, partial [Timema podura]|nr:unnamed protein product [Timema podura]